MPENAGKMQKNNRFQKGQSGNPKGKTKGTKNKATRIVESLMQNELDSICQKLLELAVDGNIQAIKLVLDRILPPKASRSVEIAIPKIENAKDALQAISMVIHAVGEGELTPSEGEAITKIIQSFTQSLQSYEFDQRLSILKNRMASEIRDRFPREELKN